MTAYLYDLLCLTLIFLGYTGGAVAVIDIVGYAIGVPTENLTRAVSSATATTFLIGVLMLSRNHSDIGKALSP